MRDRLTLPPHLVRLQTQFIVLLLQRIERAAHLLVFLLPERLLHFRELLVHQRRACFDFQGLALQRVVGVGELSGGFVGFRRGLKRSGRRLFTTAEGQKNGSQQQGYGARVHGPTLTRYQRCLFTPQQRSYFFRFTTCCVWRVFSIRSASSTPVKCVSG